MSHENVEIVRQVIEAWNRRDYETLMAFGHDDIELHLIGGFADMIGERFEGRDGVLRFWREMAQTIGGHIDFDDSRDLDGSKLLVRFTWTGSGFESGAPAEMKTGQIWTFRDGKVIHVDAYYDAAAAIEAAGLSE